MENAQNCGNTTRGNSTPTIYQKRKEKRWKENSVRVKKNFHFLEKKDGNIFVDLYTYAFNLLNAYGAVHKTPCLQPHLKSNLCVNEITSGSSEFLLDFCSFELRVKFLSSQEEKSSKNSEQKFFHLYIIQKVTFLGGEGGFMDCTPRWMTG